MSRFRLGLAACGLIAVGCSGGAQIDATVAEAPADPDVTQTATPTPDATPSPTPEPDDAGEPEIGALGVADAEQLCIDVFLAWEASDSQALLGLASPEASAALESHFGSVGALRFGGGNCFIFEVAAETDGELGAIGDVTMISFNGSPQAAFVDWYDAGALDTDPALGSRVGATTLIFEAPGEIEGAPPPEPQPDPGPVVLSQAEYEVAVIDCVYGINQDNSCALLEAAGYLAADNYGLGNSMVQAPTELLEADCNAGDAIACAELQLRSGFPVD